MFGVAQGQLYNNIAEPSGTATELDVNNTMNPHTGSQIEAMARNAVMQSLDT